MPRFSPPECCDDIYRDQSVRRVCRANLPDAWCVLDHRRPLAQDRRSLRLAPLCLAPGFIHLHRLHDRTVFHGSVRRFPRIFMTESQSQAITLPSGDGTAEHIRRLLDAEPGAKRFAIIPVLITLLAIAIAVPLCWAMWHVYMEGPWTRDGTVRVYVDRMAPEVEGKIVALPVHNNQYVHKGELLVQIDPTDYTIAVKLAEATLRQDQDNLANLQREAARRNDLSSLAVTLEQRQSADTAVLVAEAGLQQAQAQLDQAQVNLERTQIRSPANGWVTNLLAQLGDYADVGGTQVWGGDADSFWVEGYLEEPSLNTIHDGDPAKVKLLGYAP